VSKEIQEMINLRLPTDHIRNKAVEQGMVTMRDHGIRLVLDGLTSAEEVLKYT